MRIGLLFIVLLPGLALGLPACKKKSLDENVPTAVEVDDLPKAPADLPNKIDPVAEADLVAAPADEPLPDEPPPPPPARTGADYRAGLVGDVQLVRIFADRFDLLDKKARVLAYHLARAVLAGRDITFDQIHPNGLQVRQLVEAVLRGSKRTENKIEAELTSYLYALALHKGFYDLDTGHKFLPGFTFADFAQAVSSAHAAGAEVMLDKDEPLEELLSSLRRPMFDPEFQQELYPKGSGKNRDPLLASPLNLYKGVGARALKNFDELHPHNSRLVQVDGHLVEQVYRAGDRRRKIAPGRYARILRRVLRRLDDAVSSAGRTQRLILSDLSEYLRSGDPFSFDAVVRSWRAEVFEVEFLLGFLDRDTDPRRVKGLYGGLVGVLDRPGTSRLESLLRNVENFEQGMPWPAQMRFRWKNPPRVAAVHLLTSAGRVGPELRFSFMIEPDPALGQLRSRKMLLFTNVIEAYRQAVEQPAAQAFLPPMGKAAVEPSKRGKNEPGADELPDGGTTRIALRELLGRSLGAEHREVDSRLGRRVDAIRALKAELVSLWLLADPKVLELGLVSGKESIGRTWREALAEMVALDALNGESELSSVALARRILIRYLMEEAKVLEVVGEEGQAPRVVLQDEGLTQALAGLLKRCQEILFLADRQAAKALIKQYADPPAGPQWPALAQKVRALGIGKKQILIMPKLKPHRSTVNDRIEDASLSHSEDLQSQLLRVSRY